MNIYIMNMKNRKYCLLLAALLTAGVQAEEVATVSSPDGRNVVSVDLSTEGSLSYRLLRNHAELVAASPLGLVTTAEDFSTGLQFSTAMSQHIDETYTLPTGKRKEYANVCNETTVQCTKNGQPFAVVFRAYDDGVAFRYTLSGTGSCTVTADRSEVVIPTLSTCWVERYALDYSQPYPARSWSEVVALDGSKMCTPALVKSTAGGDDGWCLIAEAATFSDFPASALVAGAEAETGRFTFAMQGQAEAALPLVSPWRVVTVGSLPQIVESSLNENVCPPNAIGDTSWIHAGLSSWDWGGEDGSQTNDLNVIKDYIDQAWQMGWPYYTLDDGWSNSPYRLQDVTDYAASKGVRVFIWSHQNRFENDEAQIRSILSVWKDLGFAGVKIDFFENDSQEMMQKYEKILRVAAEQQLMVNFHGCTHAAGLRRTYPHLITSEAVFGGEQYYFNHLATPASHNITLALTRNVTGPMDYTPVEFARKDGVIRHTTTFSHQVALATVYESGIQTMSDSRENMVYQLAAPLLSVLPAAWDETRCLEAQPDEYVTMARRSGDDWYVGTLSNAARTVAIPLSFLGDGTYTAQVYADGGCPSDMSYSEQAVTAASVLSLDVKATGGATVRISKNPIAQPAHIVLEAEAGTRSGGTTLETDDKGNCRGGQFVGYIGNGQTLTHSITVDEPGIYDMTIYYITQDTRNCYVSVNGGEKTVYSFPGNGFSWASDGLAFKTVRIALKAGTNTITLGHDTENCPNIDRLEVSKSRYLKDVRLAAVATFANKSGYTASEPVTIAVANNSPADLEQVAVSYTVNGTDKVTEHIGVLRAGQTLSHTFQAKADLSAPGSYLIQAWVEQDDAQGIVGDMQSVQFSNMPTAEAISWRQNGGSIHSYSAQQNSGEAAAMLIDNDGDTKWCETANSWPWVVIELPTLCDVSGFMMADCLTREDFKNVDQYAVYLSEDAPEADNWTEVVAAHSRKTEAVKVDNIAPQRAKYVKLVVRRPEGDNAIRIYAFDVFGTEVTAIAPVVAGAVGTGAVYDLQGRKVDVGRWAGGGMPTLSKGIYIAEGKKVAVK